jgi:hypothetical protein
MDTRLALFKNQILAALLILALGFLSAVSIVFADNVSTSVTVGNAAPAISNLSMNGGNDITLTENTLVFASSTMTVTDTNGCSEISSVTAQFSFASSTSEADGSTCSYDSQTCYIAHSCTATTTGDTCDGGGDTSVEYDCKFEIWYPARPTDASSPGLSDAIWYVTATSSDGTDTGTATNTAETIDVTTLNSLDVTSSIGYGSVSAGADTGGTNQSITHTNTGNTAIDNEISGDVMCTDYSTCAEDSFTQDQQKFDTSDVTYASLTNTLAATTSPATIELDLATTSSTSTNPTDTTFWGIAIPSGQAAGSYTGQNTVSASAD